MKIKIIQIPSGLEINPRNEFEIVGVSGAFDFSGEAGVSIDYLYDETGLYHAKVKCIEEDTYEIIALSVN